MLCVATTHTHTHTNHMLMTMGRLASEKMSRMWVRYVPAHALSTKVPHTDDVKIDMVPVPRHMHCSFACGDIGVHVHASVASVG